MILIGISGKRRSGKTTLAEILATEHGFKHYSLANPLKAAVRQTFNLTVEHTDGKLKEVYNKGIKMTPRQKMIEYGALMRQEDPNYWIKKLSEEMLRTPQAQLQKAVISDIRFKNEADWIKAHDGMLIRLNRDQKLTGKNLDDKSETSLDRYKGFDITVAAASNETLIDLKLTAILIHVCLSLAPEYQNGKAA